MSFGGQLRCFSRQARASLLACGTLAASQGTFQSNPGTFGWARRVLATGERRLPASEPTEKMSFSFSDRLLAELGCLLRVARRLTRTEADAQDLVQATVVRALERRSDLRDGERIRGWLLRVQRTVLLNGSRGFARKLEVLDGGLSEAQEPSQDLEAEIMAHGFADELERALFRLGPEFREALLLREVEGLSYEEIAELQQCPVGTVRSRLARARQELLEFFNRKSEKSPWQDVAKIGSKASRRGTTEK
jgi:RNA polymerase sigma-70 factor (ECF subfamily)